MRHTRSAPATSWVFPPRPSAITSGTRSPNISGGERRGSEIADFPRLAKRLVRVGMSIAIHSVDDAGAMLPFPRLGDK